MFNFTWLGIKCVVGAVAVKLALPYVCDAVGLYPQESLDINDLTDAELIKSMHKVFNGERDEDAGDEADEEFTEDEK